MKDKIFCLLECEPHSWSQPIKIAFEKRALIDYMNNVEMPRLNKEAEGHDKRHIYKFDPEKTEWVNGFDHDRCFYIEEVDFINQNRNVEFEHKGQKFVYDAEADKRQQDWIDKHPITQAENAAIKEYMELIVGEGYRIPATLEFVPGFQFEMKMESGEWKESIWLLKGSNSRIEKIIQSGKVRVKSITNPK